MHRHHTDRSCIAEHETDPVGRILRVDGQVCRTRLQYRQQCHHQVNRPLQHHRHDGLGPHSVRCQHSRQPRRACVQFGIRDVLVVRDHRHRIRSARHLLREQLRQRRPRHGPRRVVPPVEQLLAHLTGQHPDLRQRRLRRPLQRLHETFDRRFQQPTHQPGIRRSHHVRRQPEAGPEVIDGQRQRVVGTVLGGQQPHPALSARSPVPCRSFATDSLGAPARTVTVTVVEQSGEQRSGGRDAAGILGE